MVRSTPQMGLFFDPEPTAPYVSESDTSKAAAETIQPVTGRLRTMVFDAIRESGDGGLTDDQIEVLLDLRHQTASARRRELVQQKWIKDSGRTRKTRSGSPATVWVVL